jgi:hypothetical protein
MHTTANLRMAPSNQALQATAKSRPRLSASVVGTRKEGQHDGAIRRNEEAVV